MQPKRNQVLPFAKFDGYSYVLRKEAADIYIYIYIYTYVCINSDCENVTKIYIASQFLVNSSTQNFMMICVALLELLCASRRTDGGQSEFNNCFTIMQTFDKI